MYKTRRLSKKEQFDITTMLYFLPRGYKQRIYPNDKKKMADLSSRGIEPKVHTKGFITLKWGKTYRDEQITSYKRDISLGFFTKAEIIDSFPPSLQGWITRKLANTPYDLAGDTSKMFIKIYQKEQS